MMSTLDKSKSVLGKFFGIQIEKDRRKGDEPREQLAHCTDLCSPGDPTDM